MPGFQVLRVMAAHSANGEAWRNRRGDAAAGPLALNRRLRFPILAD
jgi:hypothetical protein